MEQREGEQNDKTWRVFVNGFDARVYDYDPGPPPPFEIPESWRWVCLDEVAAPCGQRKPDEPFTYIDVGSIDNARGVVMPTPAVVEPDAAPARARKLVAKGAVIYSTVRPYLMNIAVIDRDFAPAPIVSTAFAVLNPKPFLHSRFLFCWLRSKPFTELSPRR